MGVEKIKALLSSILKEEEFLDTFVLEVILEDKKLEIFIDGDNGVDFGKCRRISRKVEEYLDESLMLGEKYKLDVSSPGATKPLKIFRQYPKHVGRSLKIILKDSSEIEGLFKNLDGETLEIEVKKKKEVTTHHILFQDIDKSYVLLAF